MEKIGFKNVLLHLNLLLLLVVVVAAVLVLLLGYW